MAKDAVKIVTDATCFEQRTDEIDSKVPYERVKHVVSLLKRTLYDNPDTPALCAPQIGEDLRLFIVKNSKKEDDRFKIFLNPMIIQGEGSHLSREKNLSFKDKQFIILRKNKIHVAYQTEDGHVTSETFLGPYAEVVQQMIEMLDGVTVADYGLDLDDVGGPDAYDNAPDKEKIELIDFYLNSLKSRSDDLEKEIEETPYLKNINDSIKFQTEVLKGNIKPVDAEGNIIDDEYIKARAHEIAVEKVKDLNKNKDDNSKKEDVK